MTYVSRTVEVQAFQLTAKRSESNSDWPEWLNRAWNKGSSEIGAVRRLGDSKSLIVVCPGGERIVNLGDWIVRDDQGELLVLDDQTFKKKFVVFVENHHRMECRCEACVAYWASPENPNHCGAAVRLGLALDASKLRELVLREGCEKASERLAKLLSGHDVAFEKE